MWKLPLKLQNTVSEALSFFIIEGVFEMRYIYICLYTSQKSIQQHCEGLT